VKTKKKKDLVYLYWTPYSLVSESHILLANGHVEYKHGVVALKVAVVIWIENEW
jgi:hypothetical protein